VLVSPRVSSLDGRRRQHSSWRGCLGRFTLWGRRRQCALRWALLCAEMQPLPAASGFAVSVYGALTKTANRTRPALTLGCGFSPPPQIARSHLGNVSVSSVSESSIAGNRMHSGEANVDSAEVEQITRDFVLSHSQVQAIRRVDVAALSWSTRRLL